MNYLHGLNDKQKDAVLHTHGPLLILAGAGAGKTKTVTHRIIHLIKEGIPGNQILAITFTNKAAKEMRERVIANLEKEGLQEERPFVSTFHSLCVSILKEQALKVGATRHFTILDESDALSLIKDALKERDLDPKQWEPRKIKSVISRNKNEFIMQSTFEKDAVSPYEKTVAMIWKRYEELARKENAFDFDDLLLKVVQLFTEHHDVLSYYQERWKFIHVDEYQDTNEVQYRLATLLAQKYKNICVVGDGDQNIYGWRGANIKNILNFENEYPDAKSVLLEENYRSTDTILRAANEVIRKNKIRKDKNLFTQKEGGEQIGLFEGFDENEEARFVAERTYDILESGVDPKEVAILYRANFQSRVLEEALLMKGVPYQVLGVKFFERKEIKDVISYLRASLNQESTSDIKRIINFPVRGIGKVTLTKLFAGDRASLPQSMQIKINNFYLALDRINTFAQSHSPSETIKFLIETTGIKRELEGGMDDDLERLENIKELATLATKYDTLPALEGIEKLIEDAALASDQDTLDQAKDQRDSVRMMTVHASKGLEFEYVFITGLEHNLFPHRKEGVAQTEDQKEEERRLFYVALTRAKKKLFLSYASIRTVFGMREITAPSEFVYDIPEDLVEREWGKNIKTIYI
ncbi:MAG: ATP-dependent helicase UvrD/PcrA [Patescibacteria group bacterium]|nr:ATP-dependent helicase UvrD/PcrA [Patescibacteria group bacterium]